MDIEGRVSAANINMETSINSSSETVNLYKISMTDKRKE